VGVLRAIRHVTGVVRAMARIRVARRRTRSIMNVVVTQSPSRSALDPDAVSRLRAALTGDAYLPGEAGFPEAVASWVVSIRHAPDIAVMPETAEDIVQAVRFAAGHNLTVGVQGTGHGIPYACEAGMLITTSRMTGVTIDPERRIARAEAGAKWAHVIPLAHEHGLAPLNGSSSDVGVVGYSLGGGHGWLARKYGRAADRIVAADVVTADGEQIRASADSHPDLFWALKGGSGNFGIVTALEFELVPVAEVFGGAVMYPLADAKRVFTSYAAWSADVPREITTSISIMRFPPLPFLPPMLQGAELVVVKACGVGDLDAAAGLIQPIRELGVPVLDTFERMPYTKIDAVSMDPVDPMPLLSGTMMLKELSEATIDALLAFAGPGQQVPLLMIEVRDLRDLDAADERARIDGLPVYMAGVPATEELAQAIRGSVGAMREALAPHLTERVLLNFLGDPDLGDARVKAAFPAATWAKFQAVKQAYDPGNRFCVNHNIAPVPVE
jgi:hypothetical protein